MDDNITTGNKRRRVVPLLWMSGALAAVILVLGVNGTLSSWTTAIIDNSQNTVASTHAVSLIETGPGPVTCDTGSTATNQMTCTTVDTYGGIGTPLNPDSVGVGDTQSVTVNLKNNGTGQGDLVLTSDACVSSALGGSTTADPVTYPVCDKVTATVVCTSPATMDTHATPVVLTSFTGGAVGTLAAGASTDCTFTLNLPLGTPAGYSSQVASQPLHWTLTAS